jgi:hypothetical protein
MLLSLLLVTSCAFAQSNYSLTPILPPVSSVSVTASGLDSSGNVLLNLTVDNFGTGQIWVSGPSGSRQLLAPPATPFPVARDISDFGRVLGSDGMRPIVWSASGQPRFLRTLAGFEQNELSAGNSAGWLVGRALSFGGPLGDPVLPMLWIRDQLVPLELPSGATRAWCSDINEHNLIVGGSVHPVAGGATRSMGWVRHGLGTPVGIGWDQGHVHNVLNAVNNAGEAAGNAFKDTGAFEGFRWSQGVFTTVAGTNELSKIVRDGTAVGLQFASSSGNAEPTVSIGAQAWALQQLLDPQSGAGWDLYWPIDLNEAGTILCQAFDPQGQAQLCVLTPISPIAGAGVSRPARTAQQRAIVERLLREHRSAFAQPARQAD